MRNGIPHFSLALLELARFASPLLLSSSFPSLAFIIAYSNSSLVAPSISDHLSLLLDPHMRSFVSFSRVVPLLGGAIGTRVIGPRAIPRPFLPTRHYGTPAPSLSSEPNASERDNKRTKTFYYYFLT